MGLRRGVSHTEFIRGRDTGEFYFLETSARVGGAHIVELVEAATGVNLWAEWAKIEIARGESAYHPPEHRSDYGGLIVSLARQQYPDTSAYQDPEIVWRLNKRAHAGLIVQSPDQQRVEYLLEDYTRRFDAEFSATHPMPARPTS
jgi:biotin carboxylase